MNIELFDKAVEFIASRSDSQLELGYWQYTIDKKNVVIDMAVAKSSEEVTCGTIACAAGWLALSPEFNALGLHPYSSGCPVFSGGYGYHAMAALFDIDYVDARNLFYLRTQEDAEILGYPDLMTDRQLWLSRARVLRAEYVKRAENKNKFRSKPVEVEAFTFEEIVQEGTKTAKSLVNGVPWSFTFRDCPVTHENDDLYLISTYRGSHFLYRGMVYVTGPNIDQVVSKAYFEENYEHV